MTGFKSKRQMAQDKFSDPWLEIAEWVEQGPEQEPMFNWLPKHKCGLHLNHNEHRNYYQTVEECYDPEDFVSEDEWLKAIKEDSVWVLQWYPNTPIGFARVAASTLEAIQQWLKEGNT